jgi:hypothetical protein
MCSATRAMLSDETLSRIDVEAMLRGRQDADE